MQIFDLNVGASLQKSRNSLVKFVKIVVMRRNEDEHCMKVGKQGMMNRQ